MSRVALITGGTRGIGAAISMALHNAGYRVVATYAGNDERAEAFNSVTGIAVYRWDVTDYEACGKGIAQVEADVGPVEILVNNAGITRDAMFHKMTPQQWHEVVNTNLNGLFQHDAPCVGGHAGEKFWAGRQYLVDQWPERPDGPSQLFGRKGGDIGFTKALAQEGAAKNITVNAICPGYIGTEMVLSVPEKVMNGYILPQIPVGRLGEPEEVARCVVFLVADDAGFITGSTITANGGQLFV